MPISVFRITRALEMKYIQGELTKVTTVLQPINEHEDPMETLSHQGYTNNNVILGKGAFGVVKKATKQGTPFAIKILDISNRLGEKKKEKRIKDMKYELLILSFCNHENVIKFYDHFLIGDTMFLIMQMAEYGSIAVIAKQKGPISESRARKWFLQMVKGLNYLHTLGVSHRDFKLHNILMHREGNEKRCKIVDFGLSRINFDEKKGVTMTDTYSGTEPYMAPEILRIPMEGRKPYDPFKCDIWSLGVCLFGLLTKAYPFNPLSKSVMIEKIEKKQFQITKMVNLTLSDDCMDLMHRLMEPDVHVRITIREILAHKWVHYMSVKPKIKPDAVTPIIILNKNKTPTKT